MPNKSYEPSVGTPATKASSFDKRVFDLTIGFLASSLGLVFGKDLVGNLVRNSAGNYTLTLPRVYRRFLGMKHGWIKCQAGQVLQPVILTDNSGTDNGSGQGTLVIEIRTAAGTATDPANGDKLSMELAFSNDFGNDRYEA